MAVRSAADLRRRCSGSFVLVALFAVAMRRFGSPLGDIVEAADRVADGDFAARVSEHGPPWCARSRARSTA